MYAPARSALCDDLPVDEDVDEVRLDVVEDPLVVHDHERARLGADELADAAGDDAQRVDVEPGVGLVEDGDPRLQHRHLEDLDPLLLAARESVVQVALSELARNAQPLHRRQHLLAELGDRDRVVLTLRALRTALIAERMKLVTVTPGRRAGTGTRKSLLLARSSASISVTSSPSKKICPSVISYAGWPISA